MTDVRSLLRSERASRRINHPNASYSATGTLECAVCKIPVKSDIDSWGKHLKSTQHAMRAERVRLAQRTPSNDTSQADSSVPINKKRKASDESDDARKKPKPAIHQEYLGGLSDRVQKDNEEPDSPSIGPEADTATDSHREVQNIAETLKIDEDEWAAFERDVASPNQDIDDPSHRPYTVPDVMAHASISAPPKLIGDPTNPLEDGPRDPPKILEDQNAEMEAEKEDAARALEDEFDEMENLEERVRRLKEKREDLKKRAMRQPDLSQTATSNIINKADSSAAQDRGEEFEGEDDDEDYDGDDWRFGR